VAQVPLLGPGIEAPPMSETPDMGHPVFMNEHDGLERPPQQQPLKEFQIATKMA